MGAVVLWQAPLWPMANKASVHNNWDAQLCVYRMHLVDIVGGEGDGGGDVDGTFPARWTR